MLISRVLLFFVEFPYLPKWELRRSAEDTGESNGKPTNVSEWLQAASANDLRQCLLSLVQERKEVSDQVRTILNEDTAKIFRKP